MLRLTVILFLAALALAACDSSDERVLPSLGTLSVTVTSSAGDSTTFSGNATARFDGDTLQTLLFAEADGTGRLGSRIVSFASMERRAPLPATYSVGGFFDSTAAFTAIYTVLSSLDRLSTEAGELTIEDVTETEVRGRFSLDVSNSPFDPDGQTRYTVRGSFGALVVRDPTQGR